MSKLWFCRVWPYARQVVHSWCGAQTRRPDVSGWQIGQCNKQLVVETWRGQCKTNWWGGAVRVGRPPILDTEYSYPEYTVSYHVIALVLPGENALDITASVFLCVTRAVWNGPFQTAYLCPWGELGLSITSTIFFMLALSRMMFFAGCRNTAERQCFGNLLRSALLPTWSLPSCPSFMIHVTVAVFLEMTILYV